jgi:hypothetical protein
MTAQLNLDGVAPVPGLHWDLAEDDVEPESLFDLLDIADRLADRLRGLMARGAASLLDVRQADDVRLDLADWERIRPEWEGFFDEEGC